ncbi:MAG TPA: FAD-dependent oxidoreductase [Methylophilus sp.]|nr:FAD-dependent oxidoreductase [Methylophilus sp.]
MKIAIVGSGIAGNTLAWHLHKSHDISVFEAESHIGGHTHTHTIDRFGQQYQIDTGFIVFNDRTYPNFISMLDKLGIDAQPSHMSFSVRDEISKLEYNGTTLNSLFAQRKNLFNLKFLQMIRDILRFNREAPELLQCPHDMVFGEYISQAGYGKEFIEYYIVPMGSAIWSADPEQLLRFPAKFFIRFFHNHGMLSVNDRPQWRVIKGGSARYVEKLTADFRQRIRLNCPVRQVRRHATGVTISTNAGSEEFDWVFFACHSDQALKMLADASPQEVEILGSIPYQINDVVLHTDVSLMPRKKLAWAAWNYHLCADHEDRATLTYNMNILQTLQSPEPFLVTLNRTNKIKPEKIIKQLQYAHPVFTPAGIAAQARHAEISGANHTCYAGAYWRNGFHEDGMTSALAALEHFNNGRQ